MNNEPVDYPPLKAGGIIENNEPVAWMQTFTQVKDGVELAKHAVNIEQVGINDIPLYTHPAQKPTMVLDGNHVYPSFKELTDEEIISTMVQFDVYSSDDHCLIEAGRAILRKAQAK